MREIVSPVFTWRSLTAEASTGLPSLSFTLRASMSTRVIGRKDSAISTTDNLLDNGVGAAGPLGFEFGWPEARLAEGGPDASSRDGVGLPSRSWSETEPFAGAGVAAATRLSEFAAGGGAF